MAGVKNADFYYGAVLSNLFNRNVTPVLIESDANRQIYDITTNNNSYLLYLKYRSNKTNTKTKGYKSWQFSFSEGEIIELKQMLNKKINLQIVLICGVKKLSQSEIAVIGREEIEKLIRLGKRSFTISRQKNSSIFYEKQL